MKRRSFVALTSMLAAFGLVVGAAGPAGAAGGGVVLLTGTTSYTPGLSTTSTNVTFTYNTVTGGYAAASAPGGVAIGTNICTFSGGGLESVALGSGTSTGSCNPNVTVVGVISITCSGTYNRVGGYRVIVLNCTIIMTDGSVHHAIELCNEFMVPVDTQASQFITAGSCKEIALD